MKKLLHKILCALFLHDWDNSQLVDGSGEVSCKRCTDLWRVDGEKWDMEIM
jgi:hypothetical protein